MPVLKHEPGELFNRGSIHMEAATAAVVALPPLQRLTSLLQGCSLPIDRQTCSGSLIQELQSLRACTTAAKLRLLLPLRLQQQPAG